MNKKDLHLMLEVRKRVRDRYRSCFKKGCSEPAIITHVLQQNGILNHIAQKGHIVQLFSDRNFEGTHYKFQKKGIAKAEVLTYKGFCPSCDNKMFEPIEKTTPDFNDYKNQILFSYRAFLSEYSNLLYGLEYYSEYIACKELDPRVKALFAPMKRDYAIAKNSFLYYLHLLENELMDKPNPSFVFFSRRNKFKFHTIEIPKIEVAASSIFSYEETIRLSRDEFNLVKPIDKNIFSRVKPIFINIIPREKSSIVILGYVQGVKRIDLVPVNKIDKLGNDEMYKLLSDILIKRIDKWCLSIPFFDNLKRSGRDKKIIALKHQYLFHPNSNMHYIKDMNLDFNLFEDLL